MMYELRGLEANVMVYIDDILIFTQNFDEHLKVLETVFQRLEAANLKMNPKKCDFARTELAYLGFIINSRGISTNPEKVSAVSELPEPKNVKDVQSIMGKLNYYSRFIADFAKLARPLNLLRRKNATWRWESEHKEAFATLKARLCSAPVMKHPDFDREFILATDASGYGIGAVLSQQYGDEEHPIAKHPDFDREFILATDASGYGIGAVLSQQYGDEEHPIAYASRTLLEAECRYAVIEREGLGIHWGINHFDEYLDGPRHFTVYTDHKPLKALILKPQTNKRLQNYAAKLSGYNFTVCYRKGSHNANADTLSRYPVIPLKSKQGLEEDSSLEAERNPSTVDEKLNRGTETDDNLLPSAVEAEMTSIDISKDSRTEIAKSFDNMSEEQDLDPLYQAIKQYLDDPTVTLDSRYETEIRSSAHLYTLNLNGELMRSNLQGKLVRCLPAALREFALHEAHDILAASHGGREKTIRSLADNYWWSTLYRDVERYLKCCSLCMQHKRSNKIKRPLGERPAPQKVWERVHLDLWQPGGTSEKGNVYVAAFIDTVSKYVIVECIPDKTAETIARVFAHRVVCTYGIPDELYSDGAAEFRSRLMSELTTAFGVTRKITTPYRPQANGQIERVFSTLAPMLATAVHKYPRRWDEFLPYVIFAYNTAYHRSIRDMPFRLFYGREPYPEQLELNRIVNSELLGNNSQRIKYMKRARETALQHMELEAHKRKTSYDKTARPTSFQLDDIVMLKSILPRNAPAPKLFPLYVGPFRVTIKKGEVLGVVPVGHPAKKPRYIHSDRARLCIGDCVPNPSLAELLTPFDPSVIDQNIETDIPESQYED
jgi:transposase InsO family protein